MSEIEDDILERLQKHLVGEIRTLGDNGGYKYTYKDIRPPIKCRNEGSLSVQASRNHYCWPREDAGPYQQVEVGAVHGLAGVVMLLAEYHDGEPEAADDGPWSVFGYVPIEKVAMLISMNGGIEDEIREENA